MYQFEEDVVFSDTPWPVALLNVGLDNLAQSLGLRVDDYTDDLSEATGFTVPLLSGVRVMAIERVGNSGATLYVFSVNDLTDIDLTLADVLYEFGLTDLHVQTRRLQDSDDWISI